MNEIKAVLKLEEENHNLKVQYNTCIIDGNTVITKVCLKWNSEMMNLSGPKVYDTIWKLQNVQKLEFLHLPYRSIQSIEAGIGIGNFSNSLKEFSLRGCRNLFELPREIGLLINMTSFTISHCRLNHGLPSEIGNLVSLTNFQISHCSGLRCLPSEIGNLVNLQELEIHNNNSLQCIPAEIGNINSLKILKIASNEQLQTIPTEIGKIMGLRLEWSHMFYLPPEICSLKGLYELKVVLHDYLRPIPPEIGNLKNLIKLEISQCNNLETIPSEIGNLSKLEELVIANCACLAHLPIRLGNLTCLLKLDIDDCPNLEDLPPSIGNIGGSLKEVSFSGCDRLEHFPPEISKWENLRSLEISYDDNGNQVKNCLSKLTNAACLQEMIIDSCRDLECLPPEIGNLRYLQKLEIYSCDDLNGLCPEIGCLNCLQELIIKSCLSLRSLPAEIGNLKNLRKLGIAPSDMSLQLIPLEMGNLESLQELIMPYCGCLERLSIVINNLKGLREMYIEYNFCPDPLLRDYIIPTSSIRPDVEFYTTLEYFCIGGTYFSSDLNNFLQHIAAEPSELSPVSFLLPKSIRRIDFNNSDESIKRLDKDVILKLLQKYPKLVKIRECLRGIPGFLTVDMVYQMYFNRFVGSLQVEVRSTSGDDRFPSLFFTEKVWPIVLEEVQQGIQKDVENMKDEKFNESMLSASVIYPMVREVILPLLMNW